MFTDSWIYRGFMRFDLWTKQHGGQGIDRVWSFTRRLPWFEHCIAQFCYATLNFDERSHYSLSTCWIWGYTCKTPIIAHIALEQGTLCWLLTAARYIALSLISRYLSLDPNNRDISGLHCTRIVIYWHISNITPMISQRQISCNTPMFCIAAILMKYCYTTGSWLL